jgi:hypothetical protein
LYGLERSCDVLEAYTHGSRKFGRNPKILIDWCNE